MVLIVLIILVAAIILNSFMMRKEANRREYEHERRQERFERLMDFLQKTNSDKNVHPDSNRESNSSIGRIETTEDD